MDVAAYFVTLGFKVDKSQVAKVDKTLKDFEKGLKKNATAEGTVAKSAAVSAKKVVGAEANKAKAIDKTTAAIKKGFTESDKGAKRITETTRHLKAQQKEWKNVGRISAGVVATRRPVVSQKSEGFGVIEPRVRATAKTAVKKGFDASDKRTRHISESAQSLRARRFEQTRGRRAAGKELYVNPLSAKATRDRQKDLEKAFGAPPQPTAAQAKRAAKAAANPPMVRNGPVRIVDQAARDATADRVAKIKNDEATKRAAVTAEAARVKKADAAATKGGKDLAEAEKKRTNEAYARRKKQLADLKRLRMEEDALAQRNHASEMARIRAEEAARRRAAAKEKEDRRRRESQNDNGRNDNNRRERRSGMAGAGFAGGLASRLAGPAIAIAGGAYGLGALNRRNQEIMSAQLGANAILGESGPQDIQWLKDQADRVGFNWLDAAPEFTGFIGAAAPLMGKDASMETFQAFNEFATTRHAPALGRKRALMALKQMASKATVMSEELYLQLGEAQGFTEMPMMFAEALQQKTGGSLKGADAAGFLKKEMKLGNVKAADILPIVTKMMSEKAAPTLAMSAKASQAEQARFQNASNAQVVNANANGVESGYSRLFKTFTVTMEESSPLVKKMARGFDQASKSFSEIVLNAQSLKRFFEGRDSYIGEKLFPTEEGREKAFLWLSSVKGLFTEIANLGATSGNGWNGIFEQLFSSDSLSLFSKDMQTLTNIFGAFNDASNGNWGSAYGRMAAVVWDRSAPVRELTGDAIGTGRADALFGNAPFNQARFDVEGRAGQELAIARQRATNYAQPILPVPNVQYNSAIPGVTPIEIRVDVKADITAQNAQDFAEQLNERIMFAMPSFVKKETH